VLACCRPLFLVWLRCWFCIAAAAVVVAVASAGFSLGPRQKDWKRPQKTKKDRLRPLKTAKTAKDRKRPEKTGKDWK
jgi:hypothetical protein